MKQLLISTAIILILIFIGTGVGIYYARGYRFDFQNPKAMLQGTGLLVLTSKPDGARVLIDDHLTTATNNTINLQPGSYKVRIEKDGYFSWKKTVQIKKETVSSANATLFPTAPRLESITTTGANNPVIDPTGNLIAFTVSSSSAEKNGVYTFNMAASNILPLGGGTSQITNDFTAPFSSALLSFSPAGNELLASISGQTTATNYLIQARSFNQNPKDVTATLNQTLTEWESQKVLRDQKLIDSLPKKIRAVAKANFGNPVISPEDDKILYTASMSATLPILIKPRLPGTNSTPEKRTIEAGNVYVYDMKEDRNYLLSKKDEMPAKYLWHPDSGHLIFVRNANINIIEYDGQNQTTVYAGPFSDNLVYPLPNGSSLVILTNLNIPDAPKNLYRISLR